MSAAAWLFFASSVLGWLAYVGAARGHARDLRRLAQEHRNDMARHGIARFREGLNLAKERRRMGRDWQEAAHAPTTAAVVTRMTL